MYKLDLLVSQSLREIKELLELSKTREVIFKFSGGKDSHALVALLALAHTKPYPNVKIVHSDTTIEYPMLSSLTLESLEDLGKLGINTQVVRATPDQRLFATVFGLGYPVPKYNIRHCTDRLKIRTYKAPKDAIIVTGEHKGESKNRDKKLCGTNECGNDRLVGNIARPLLLWENCDIWDFLHTLEGTVYREGFINKITEAYDLVNDGNRDDSLRTGCVACPVVSPKNFLNDSSKKVDGITTLAIRMLWEDLRADNLRVTNPRHKSGSRVLGSIAIPARRYYWYEAMKPLLVTLSNSGLTLVGSEELEYIENSLDIGRYPPTYYKYDITTLEQEWRARCPEYITRKGY